MGYVAVGGCAIGLHGTGALYACRWLAGGNYPDMRMLLPTPVESAGYQLGLSPVKQCLCPALMEGPDATGGLTTYGILLRNLPSAVACGLVPPSPTQLRRLLAQRVGRVVEAHYGAGSLTLAIQDGPLAGGRGVSHGGQRRAAE